MNLQDDTPRTGRSSRRSRSDASDSPARLHSRRGSAGVERAIEHVTFGRRSLLLFRIWVVQVVLLLTDVGVFRSVYPLLRDVFRTNILLEACLVLTLGCVALLWTYLGKMGRLSFARRYHGVRSRCWSALGYLVLGGVIVAGAFHVLDMTPGVSGPHLELDLVIAALLTAALAALLAIGFYAQFGAGAFPRRRHTQRVIDEWLASLDWPENAEGSTEKDRRYAEFEVRTRQVAALLDSALTHDGRALRDEFHDWHGDVQRYSLLTQERIVAGDTRNPELADHHERLQALRGQLAGIADGEDYPESLLSTESPLPTEPAPSDR